MYCDKSIFHKISFLDRNRDVVRILFRGEF